MASLSQDERIALWDQRHNAFTIKLINDHEERCSIRRIGRILGLVQTGGAWRGSTRSGRSEICC